ncbi:hypothetical protein [Vibrio phage S4-7]|nr:hypothetical protein [Vibrio phage S4-7]
MSKSYPTCLTRDYLSRWSLEDGIRELIQNSVDQDSNYIYREGGELVFNTFGGTIDPKNLLLGVGTKTSDDSKRGGFSEGLLLSLLIMAREEVDITFINGEYQWIPVFEYNEDYQCETLTILEEYAEESFDGVSITIDVGDSVADTVEKNTLFLQDDYEHYETSQGTILLGEEHKGRIYVGGLFVDLFDSQYGFDFLPECFELDRDRKSLKPFDIQWTIKDLIAEMSSSELDDDLSDRVVSSMESNDKSMQYVNTYSVSDSENFKKSAEKLYNEKYGGMILTSDYSEAEELRESGNKNVAYVNNSSFVTLVKSSESHQVVYGARKEKETFSIDEMLDKFEDEWQHEMNVDMYEAWEKLSNEIKERT